MKLTFQIVKYILIVYALISVLYKASFMVWDRERLSLLKYLDNNEKIEGYYFGWYEGVAYSVDLWLANDQYLHFDLIYEFSPRKNTRTIFGTLEQIGNLRISCLQNPTQINEKKPIYRGFDVNELFFPDKNGTIDDLINDYDKLYEMIFELPNIGADKDSINASPDIVANLQQPEENLVAVCSKQETDPPALPLDKGVKTVFRSGGGYYFHHKRPKP